MKTKPLIVVYAVAVVLAAGCTTDSGSSESTASAVTPIATPGPTGSTSAHPAPEEEARAAFDNLTIVQNAAAQDYYREWDARVLPLTSGDLYENFWRQGQRFGGGSYYQAGPDSVTFQRFLEIEDDMVVMELCVDSSGSQIIGPDGTPVPDTWRPDPGVSHVTVTRVVPPEADTDPQGLNWWRVSKYVIQNGTTCSL